jgi:hypothetical protein
VISNSVVRLDEAAERLAVEVIRSGILAQGPMVAGFERECAELLVEGTAQSLGATLDGRVVRAAGIWAPCRCVPRRTLPAVRAA